MRRIATLCLAVPFVLFAAPLRLAAQQTDAKAIYQNLEPSIVYISDAEGGGSGVVISADGLILTNYHVANTPLPMTVEAFVETNGTLTKKALPNAILFKVHASNDLALVKVDLAGGKLRPAKLSKDPKDAVTGGTCFVLGFPALGLDAKPALTITKGIISAAKRMIGESPYIQMDAAINPGNSGGALINDKGLVIGIPTLKFEDADRIGMAAPLADLKLDQFVKPSDKPGNPQEAARLSRLADMLFARDAFSLGQDPEAVQTAIYLQRQALALAPDNAQLSLSLALMYHRLKKFPLARAYGEIAVRNEENNPFSRALLADIYEQMKDMDKAKEQWLACISLPPSAKSLAQQTSAFEKLAAYYVAHQDPVRACYTTSWALAAGAKETTAQRLVLQSIAGTIPQPLIDEILAKKQGHSIADMETVASRAPIRQPVKASQPLEPAKVADLQPDAPVQSVFSAKVEVGPGVTVKLLDAPPTVVYHPDRNTLDWTPAPFSKVPTAQVLLLLIQPDGSEEVRTQAILRR